MAVWALLSISQTVKATNTYYVRGAFGDGAWPAAKSGLAMTPKGNNTYVLEYKSEQDGEFRFRFTGDDFENEMCPYATRTDLSTFSSTNPYVISSNCYENPNIGNGRYFIVNMKKGTTYVFTFKEGSSRQVWCDVNTSTTPSKFARLYVWGNISGSNWGENDFSREFTTSDGKTYQYVFGTDYTNAFSNNTADFYFRVKTESKQYAPYKNDDPVGTEYTDAKESSEGAWKLTMTKGKSYTLIFDYEKKQIKYTEGGSSVVTKVIKLVNGSSEVTGSNGKYTLDLSGASSDAQITLTINDAKYGLATAQTISAAGTTSGIAFTTEGTEALTLKAGLIYSLSVTEDGKMTVEAKEKVNPYKVAGAGFYLVGDFMSPYNHSDVNPGGDIPGKINYERLYFKFEQQTDGSYKIDIPACLTAKMQILGISVDGVPSVYGPSDNVDLYGAKDHGTASPVTDGSVGGNSNTDNLVVVNDFNDQKNYWNLVTRNDGVTDDDGIYEVSFTFDSDSKTPKIWTIKHNSLKRVVYLLSNAQGATAQPLYDSRRTIKDGYSDVSSASAVHLEGITSKYFVLGTVVRDLSNPNSNIYKQAIKADDGIHMISDEKGGKQCGTHTKFFFLGADPVYESDNTTIVTKDSYKLTANKPAVAISKLKGNKIVEVNPTKGNNDEAGKDNSYGMQAEIYVPNAGKIDYPDVISMVGPAIPSTTTTNVDGTTKWLWNATAGDMTYDESDHCYKLVLNTSADLYGKTFRFVGDHAITQNWYEDGTPANVKYPIEKVEGTSEATVADPNVVNYTSDCTENTIVHDSDIKWNRGAGLWTVRFYIIPGKDNKNTFQYTITGASKIYIPVTAHMGKLLRTYTSAVDVVPVDANVLIYAAQSYTKNNENNTGSGDETGTVKLYRLKFIPANQGVVLYSPNSPLGNGTPTKLEVVPAYSATVLRYSSNAYDYIEDWAKSADKKSMWVNQHENENWNNYLMPVLTDTKVTQFYYDEKGEWTGRIFSFTRYSKTDTGRRNDVIEDNTTDPDSKKHDYFSFFRAAGTVKASYSYLMLPRTIMEGNGQILDQSQDNDTKLFSKSMVWFEGIDAPMDNETTGISELKNHVSNTDAAYYTLQGVKVAKPVKGIYIHQGKKVIVK